MSTTTKKPSLWDNDPSAEGKKDFFGKPLYEPVWVAKTNKFLLNASKFIMGLLILAFLIPLTLFLFYVAAHIMWAALKAMFGG